MKLFTLGALALLVAGSTLVPAGNATHVATDCSDNATLGQNTILAAGFAFGINWTPDCITVTNGQTITWQTADAEPVHGPLFIGTHVDDETQKVVDNDHSCWAAPAGLVVPNADRDVVRLTWNADKQTVDFVAASTRTSAAATGGSSIATGSCGLADGVTVLDAHTVDLAYQCILHKAAMTGHIHLKV